MSPFSGKTKIVAAGAVLIFAALVVALLYQPAPPAVVLPNPNGYDDFIKAGQELTGDPYSYRDGGGEKVLCTFVANNAEPLRLVRTGLKRDCRVPLEYSQSYLTTHITRLALLKRLAQTQAAEGNLAQMEHRYGDAARAYLDTIRLGHESTRGGVLIDSLVGIAIEALGSTPLQPLVSRLNAKNVVKPSRLWRLSKTNENRLRRFGSMKKIGPGGASLGVTELLANFSSFSGTAPSASSKKGPLKNSEP